MGQYLTPIGHIRRGLSCLQWASICCSDDARLAQVGAQKPHAKLHTSSHRNSANLLLVCLLSAATNGAPQGHLHETSAHLSLFGARKDQSSARAKRPQLVSSRTLMRWPALVCGRPKEEDDLSLVYCPLERWSQTITAAPLPHCHWIGGGLNMGPVWAHKTRA